MRHVSMLPPQQEPAYRVRHDRRLQEWGRLNVMRASVEMQLSLARQAVEERKRAFMFYGEKQEHC